MYKIVIIDDEPKICEGLANLFPWDMLGFEVTATFTDGARALEYINSASGIDVVMTDIEMPGITGLEIARRLKDGNTRVVFFSAYSDFEYARDAILNRVCDYLLKPLSFAAVQSCLSRIKAQLDAERESSEALNREAFNREAFNIEGFVKNYIRQNIKTATLEEAASLAHYSMAYMSTGFKAACGCTFSDWLLKERMERALPLISERRNKLYTVAEAVGYRNPKNLSRNFKDWYGITPQELRAGKEPLKHI